MRRETYAAIAILLAAAACSASGTDDDPRLEPETPERDASLPGDDGGAPTDARFDVDPDGETELVCGDAGFCETRLPRSDVGAPLSLRGVWIAAPNDVWSVSLEGHVLHYDGTSWTTAYRANHELYSVWATPSSVWVGGEGGLVLHRDAAGAWSLVDAGHVGAVRAIYGVSEDDIWFSRQADSVDHFDGTKFENVATGISGLEIGTVFGRAGFGVYAAGRVRPTFAGSGIVPDQPYVFALSRVDGALSAAVLNTSLTEKRGLTPTAGFVSDSPDPDRRIFLAGYEERRVVRPESTLIGYSMKYGTFGAGNPVVLELLTLLNPALPLVQYPDWAMPGFVGESEFRFMTTSARFFRWDGVDFTTESLAMGYERPNATVFAAHNVGTLAWMVGNGFAMKGALP